MTEVNDSTYELTSREAVFFNRLRSVLNVLFTSAKVVLPIATENIDLSKIITMEDVPKIYFKDILDNENLPQKLLIISNHLKQYISGFDFHITYSDMYDIIDLYVLLKQKNGVITITIGFTPHVCFCNKVECKIYTANDNNGGNRYGLWMHHHIGKHPTSGFITDNDSPVFNQILLTMFHKTLREINYSDIEEGIKHTIDAFRLLD